MHTLSSGDFLTEYRHSFLGRQYCFKLHLWEQLTIFLGGRGGDFHHGRWHVWKGPLMDCECEPKELRDFMLPLTPPLASSPFLAG